MYWKRNCSNKFLLPKAIKMRLSMPFKRNPTTHITKGLLLTPFLAICDFCRLLITFANSLDPYQDRQTVRPTRAFATRIHNSSIGVGLASMTSRSPIQDGHHSTPATSDDPVTRYKVIRGHGGHAYVYDGHLGLDFVTSLRLNRQLY